MKVGEDKGGMRNPGIIALMLILLFQALSLEAQRVEISLAEPEWVEESSGFNLTVVIAGAPEGFATISLRIMKGDAEVFSRILGITLSERSNVIAIPVDPIGEPGVYNASVRVSIGDFTISHSEELYIAPSFSRILRLTARISEVDKEISRIKPILRNESLIATIDRERRRIYNETGELIRLLIQRKDLKGAATIFANISSELEVLAEEVSALGGYEAFIWSSLSPFDYALKFPSEIKYFWIRLIPAFLALLLLLFLLYPLYSTEYSQLANQLAELEGDGESLMREVRRRAEEIFKTTKKEIEASNGGKSYVLLIFASFLASVGLMSNNITAIIGSMLLSSLMGMIVASSMNLAIYDAENKQPLHLFYRGMRISLMNILIVILFSMIIALIGSFFIPIQATPELIARSSPNLADLMIAACAGAVGALSVIYRREVGPLVGSAIAIALVPPAAAVGVSAAMMNPALFSGTLFLLTVNVLALVIMGYLSAKIYTISPVLSRMMSSREGGNPLTGLFSFLEVWFRAITVFLGGSIKLVIKRISSIAVLPLLALLLAIFITTEIPLLFSAAHSSILSLINWALYLTISLLPYQLSVPKWLPLLLSLITFLLSAAALSSEVREYRESRTWRSLSKICLLSSIIWFSLGYMLGIHILSSIAAVFTVSFIIVMLILLYKPWWERKAGIALKLFIVLTLTVLLINSASVFSELSLRQRVYSSGFIDLSRELISAYLGVLPEDVRISFEGINTVKATVRVDLMKLESLRDIRGIERLIEHSLREAAGSDVKLTLEFSLKPS